MSILSSLNRAYERLLAEKQVPTFGFSTEKIGFVISLNPDGTPAGKPRDIRDTSQKKPIPRMMAVPQPAKRTSGISPNFLWDKTSYVLGVSAGEGKRLGPEHQAFVNYHQEVLKGTEDEGLKALLKFLDIWKAEMFESLDWPEEMKDQNIVFALESERLNDLFLHDHPEARKLWAKIAEEGDKTNATCLVTGEKGPIARLHPAIKGIWGGQSSGGSIVSFNLDSFSSYGHERGDNAPVSEAAAFAYTTTLNKFLGNGSNNRIQIGDASVVFWADGAEHDKLHLAEQAFSSFFSNDQKDAPENEEYEQEGKIKDLVEAKEKIRPILQKIQSGESLRSFDPELANGVHFYVLGLSPNASRISIRFWIENSFGEIAKNYQKYLEEMRITLPEKHSRPPALWQYLSETAVQGKRENVPPLLAGQWVRAILTGTRYPQMLLSTILIRIRADHDVNARRAAILKSVLIRNFDMEKEAPVALDPENTNKGYLLGRLFAVYERIQSAALGNNVNATIKDKYYGSASAQPRKVFRMLDGGSANHLSKIGKKSPGLRVNLEKNVAEIMAKMSPSANPYPTAFSSEEQALFALGYYHQRETYFTKKDDKTSPSKEKEQ